MGGLAKALRLEGSPMAPLRSFPIDSWAHFRVIRAWRAINVLGYEKHGSKF